MVITQPKLSRDCRGVPIRPNRSSSAHNPKNPGNLKNPRRYGVTGGNFGVNTKSPVKDESSWRIKELVKTKKSLWLGNSQTVSILLLRDKTLLPGQFMRGTSGVGVIPHQDDWLLWPFSFTPFLDYLLLYTNTELNQLPQNLKPMDLSSSHKNQVKQLHLNDSFSSVIGDSWEYGHQRLFGYFKNRILTYHHDISQ